LNIISFIFHSSMLINILSSRLSSFHLRFFIFGYVTFIFLLLSVYFQQLSCMLFSFLT
jgi:hypothetical protein